MATEILLGLTSILKVYTDPLPEYDNWKFARSSSTAQSVNEFPEMNW